MVLKKLSFLLISFLLTEAAAAQFEFNAETEAPDILTEVRSADGLIVFKFLVKSNLHITELKNKFFNVTLEKNRVAEITQVEFPQGTPYGEEMVFKGQVNVKVYLKLLSPVDSPQTLTFTASYQICQEKPVERCFAPESVKLNVTFDSTFASAAVKEKSDQSPAEIPASLTQKIEHLFKNPTRSLALLFGLVFLAGFLTSLTPCVYPVIPIVMGYVGARSKDQKWRGFVLSLFFILGLSLVYSILGAVAATTGSMMGISFQNPIVVVAIATIFLTMGLSLVGFFTIQAPTSLTAKLGKSHRSEWVGALIIGGISGIIAAPCVGPVLIALLSWISQTRNIILGFFLTFVFSLGMSVIFIIAGTFSGAISSLPKGGKWMEAVKYFFALLLIGSGLYFIDTLIPAGPSLLLWGGFLVAVAVFAGLLRHWEKESIPSKVLQIGLMFIFLVGAFLSFKGLESIAFPRTKDAKTSEIQILNWLSRLDEAKKMALSQNKKIMIDTYADWCQACKELDEKTFSRPEVSSLLEKLVLVKLDFTRRTAENERLKKELEILGMPTLIFLNPDGSELKRFSGFIPPEDFVAILNSL